MQNFAKNGKGFVNMTKYKINCYVFLKKDKKTSWEYPDNITKNAHRFCEEEEQGNKKHQPFNSKGWC